ncbi:MAG: RNA-binding protein [Candidatus Melainabacteria bacterium]|nr:RNA-binding protein [Candidatus Melainabacteria bacterium]
MTSKLFIANLPYAVTEDEIAELFGNAGAVVSIHIPRDRDTGRSRGFGFVEMETDEGAQEVINAYNQHELHGRKITVEIQRPQEQRPRRQGGGHHGGGGGGRGGYGGGGGRGDYGGGGGREYSRSDW